MNLRMLLLSTITRILAVLVSGLTAYLLPQYPYLWIIFWGNVILTVYWLTALRENRRQQAYKYRESRKQQAYQDELKKRRERLMLTPEYWDCEYEGEDYIRPAKQRVCSKCGRFRDESPDSRVLEVEAHGLKIEDKSKIEYV